MNQSNCDLIIHNLKKGEENGLREILASFYPAIFIFTQKFIANRYSAEAITQECFVKLWLLRERFDNMENIKAFLYITARNYCFNFLSAGRNNQEAESSKPINIGTQNHVIRAEVLRLLLEVKNNPNNQGPGQLHL